MLKTVETTLLRKEVVWMAKKRHYKGQELPKGVTFIERNGSAYFYARIDGKRKYQGEGEKGLFLATKAVEKIGTDKDLAQLYSIGREDLARTVKRSRISFAWDMDGEQGSGATVKDLLMWYMTRPGIKKQTSYSRKEYSTLHLIRLLGKKHVSQLLGDALEDYKESRLNEEAAPGTVNLEMNLLQGAFNLARKRNKIPADIIPAEFTLKDKPPPRREIIRQEYEKLLKVADSDFRDVLVCAYESAMRSKEIHTLAVDRVHLNETHIEDGERVLVDYIKLDPVDTKTGLDRNIPVSRELKEVLERRIKGKGPKDLVFTSEGRPYYREWIVEKMRACCKKAGVPYGDRVGPDGKRVGVVFHCFRHTRTVIWIRKGFSDTYIRTATGHKTLNAYRTYADKAASPAGVMRLVNGWKPLGEVQKKGITRHTNACRSAV